MSFLQILGVPQGLIPVEHSQKLVSSPKPPLGHTQEELRPHILWRSLILASLIHDLILSNVLMVIDEGLNVGKLKALPFGLAPSSSQGDHHMPFSYDLQKTS